MLAFLNTIVARVWALLRDIARDQRGTTTEQVIWIAALAAFAIAVALIFGPRIIEAANKVKFTP